MSSTSGPLPDSLGNVRPLALRKMALGAAVCLLLGMAILVAGSCIVDTHEPHLVGALNDQMAYTNTARSLVAKGTLQSNTILPATLWQKTTSDVLYMPGHPAAIAVSYKVFGIGPFQSILPSLVSYLIAMLAIYLIGARCYSPVVGLVASLLFALFPPALFFTYTAMAELTLVAAFTSAVCACVYLPHRLRPWLGPFCLAVPFLFRESAALMALPLGLYFWLERRDQLAWRSLVFVALSVVLMGALYRSDFSAGRPSLLKANIFGDRDTHAVYDDASAQQAVSNPSWRDWIRVIPARTMGNLKSLFSIGVDAPWVKGGNYTLMAAIALVGLVAFVRRDKFAWSLSALNLITGTVLVMLFSVRGYLAIRYLLFAHALNVVVVASVLVRVSARLDVRRLILVGAASIFGASLSVFSLVGVKNIYAFFAAGDEIDRRHATAVESIGHDDSRMLVTPYQLSVRYRYDHFPVVFALAPYNLHTLELLAARFDIGTLILNENHPLLQNPAALARLGFYREQLLSVNEVNYIVYKRPAH